MRGGRLSWQYYRIIIATRLVLNLLLFIISASLSIRIASRALMLLKFRPPVCLSAHVSSGKTANWIRMPFGVVSGVGPGIHVLDGSPRASRGRGCFWHGFRHFSEFWAYCFEWGNDVLIDDRLVCEKLSIFPYADYIIEFSVKLPFLRYSRVQDRGEW